MTADMIINCGVEFSCMRYLVMDQGEIMVLLVLFKQLSQINLSLLLRSQFSGVA